MAMRTENYFLAVALFTGVFLSLPGPSALDPWPVDNEGLKEQTAVGCLQNSTPIFFAVFLSFPEPGNSSRQPSIADGPEIAPAVALAVDQVNARGDLLHDYCLTPVFASTGCNLEARVLLTLLGHIVHGGRVAGIVGPSCSSSAIAVSSQTSRNSLSLINFHIASAHELEDRSRYGNAFGVVGPSSVYISTLKVLSRAAQWDHVGVYYDDSRPFFYLLHKRLLSELAKSGVTVAESAPLRDHHLPHPHNLATDLRIFFILSSSELIRRHACLITKGSQTRGFIFPLFQLIMVEALLQDLTVETSFSYHGNTYTCSKAEMEQALNGSLFLHYQLTPEDHSLQSDTMGISYDRYWQLYQQRANAWGVMATEWANPVYDAVWSLALALNHTLLDDPGFNLSTYHHGNPTITELIRSKVTKLDFQGVSGEISYNASTGYNTRAVDIFQAHNHAPNLVGHYHPSRGLRLVPNTAVFLDDTLPERLVVTPLWLAALLTAITVTLLLSTVAAHCLTWVYRERKSVKASGVRMGHLSYLSCYVLIVGALCYTWGGLSLSDAPHNYLCHLQNYTLSVAFTLMLGTVAMKTWRLYRIFTHFTKPGGAMLSDWSLTVAVAILCLIQALVCAAQAIVQPGQTRRERSTRLLSEYPFVVVETRLHCDPHVGWLVYHVASNGVLLTAGTVFCLLTRHVQVKLFRLNNYSVFLYSLVLLYGLMLPVYYLSSLTNLRLAMYAELCATLDLTLLLSLLCLSLVPLWPVLVPKLAPCIWKRRQSQ